MFKKTVPIIMTMCMLTSGVFAAQSTDANVGTTGAQFLKIGVGGRATGMGGAFCAVANDASALYWNPGGLAFLQKRELLTQHIEWFQGVKYEHLTIALPTHKGYTIAAGFNYLYINDIERRTTDTENPEGYFGANDKAAIIGISKTMNENLSIGVNGKYIASTLDDKTASAYAMDAGVLWKAAPQWHVGCAIQNVGTKMKFIQQEDPLPMNIKGGVGYFYKDLTVALDVNKPNDNRLNAVLGMEYALRFDKDFMLPIRAGYKTLNDLDAMSALSAGIGFGYKDGIIDFAWVPYGEDLGDTYRMSLDLKF